ncbi:MAG: hypothetical protein IJN94_00475 [Clostridia bacterium]|nr:hypothetical protein [Clostridia bacterium]
MKKIISVLLCAVFLFSAFSFSAFAVKDNTETEKETELVLEIDVNKRYTDIYDETDGMVTSLEEKKELTDNQKTVYIAILCAALVVSVVILAVSLKKVPKEEDIDISGQNKIKKR